MKKHQNPNLAKCCEASHNFCSVDYTGAHSQILFESVGVLEVLANAEEKKELEAEAAKEPKLEVVPEPEAEEEPAVDPDKELKEDIEVVHVEDGV